MIRPDERQITQPVPILLHESYFTQFYGAQIGVYNLLRYIDRTKVTPLVVCPGEGVFTERVRALGVEVVVVPLPPDLTVMGGMLLRSSIVERPSQFIRALPQVLELARLIRARKIRLMYCDLTRSVLSSGWAAKLTGIPVVWHVKGDKLGRADDIAYLLSDRVVSVSENVRKVLCQRWRSTRKVVCVHDGIPLDRFNPSVSGRRVRTELGFTDDHVVVGTVGSLGPRKGHHVFIRMAELVAAQHPAARFMIVGDVSHEGDLPYKRHLLSLGRQLMAEGRLVFTGWRDDMPEVYAAMDVFTLASSAEGLPLTVLEAMAMAKPTVSSRTVSADELVVDGKTGYVVPIDDAPAMAAAVSRLIDERDLRIAMGAAARDRAATGFSVERMVGNMERIFLETLRKPTGGAVCEALPV